MENSITNNSVKKELLLCTIAVALVLLNIGAHLLCTKMFVDLPLTEITLALIPITMLALCIFGFKMAAREQ
ncbi:hypothetical protein [Vibrio methylphosphonaticus]|uniref:hypothetical protein n=1 Tax=Vibrio methylphosphonaticus TaxID=2946866 RepID=UPI002029D57B|nr:hypothetical protein [Vibrio methylphosphonaticus]MCL9776686.1 hypothetical protein [Vibrio methylphosphonaticus]